MLTLKFQLTLLCLMALVFVQAQSSEHQWKEGRSGKYQYRYVSGDPMKARFYTLDNGLTVILSPNSKEPRIQTLIAIRAGSNTDPETHTGLAHYLEHMLFKGTYRFGSLDSVQEHRYLEQIESLYDEYNNTTDSVKRKEIYKKIDSVSGIAARYTIPNEYDKMMTSMGAQGTNAHTHVEETVYHDNIPSNSIDKFLAVQRERFRSPVFRLFHTELEAVYEEKNRSLDNDNRKVWEAMLNAMFPTHNYGQQSTIGTIEHLRNPSLKAIREYYNKYYVPNNMAVIMAGDFDPDQVIAKVDKAFDHLRKKELSLYEGPAEKPLEAPVVREVTGPDAEYLQLGYRMPGIADNASVVTMAVVDQLLHNGKAGLLDINLNQQQKVLTSATILENWKDYSFLVLYGKAREGQSLENVKDLLLSQVALLKKGAFDESLIKSIVANFKFHQLEQLEDNSSRANSLMDAFILHKGALWQKEVAFTDQMSKVSKQQVVDFVNQYMNDNYVLVYKRKGENSNLAKVDKPTITPVVLNRDTQSVFVQEIEKMPVTKNEPRWIDYQKTINTSKVGPATVYFVRNEDNDLFRLHYRIDMGNRHSKKLGLAAGYLQYLGDGKRSAEEINKKFYDIACNYSVKTASDFTTITLTGLNENFDQAVSLFEGLLRNCKPDEAALKNLKARTEKSRADAKLSKSAIARGLTYYAIYGPENPYNYQLSSEALNNITADELVEILHQLPAYRHDIIYYGPETLQSITKKIKSLHPLPADFKAIPEPVKYQKRDIETTRVLFTPYDMVQAEITWISNAQTYDSTNLPVIELFNNYFGGNMGSVVFQTIRESKALAYSTYAMHMAPDKKGDRYTTMAYVGSQAEKMDEAIEAMNELLAKLPRSEKSLDAARESILQDIASQRILQDDIVFSYLTAKRLGLQSDIRKYIYEQVQKMGFDEIEKFHKSQIANGPFTYCVIASPDKVSMTQLKKIGEVKQVSLEEIFGY